MSLLIFPIVRPYLLKVGVVSFVVGSFLPLGVLHAASLNNRVATHGFWVAEAGKPAKKKASLKKRRKRTLRANKKKKSTQNDLQPSAPNPSSQESSLSVRKDGESEVVESTHTRGHLIKIK